MSDSWFLFSTDRIGFVRNYHIDFHWCTFLWLNMLLYSPCVCLFAHLCMFSITATPGLHFTMFWSSLIYCVGPSDAPLAPTAFEAFVKVPNFLRPHTQIYCTRYLCQFGFLNATTNISFLFYYIKLYWYLNLYINPACLN